MFARALLILACLLLGACAADGSRTGARVDGGAGLRMDADMPAWAGKTYLEFIAAKGAPQVTIVGSGGAKTLEYVRERVLHQHSAPAVVTSPVSVGNVIVPVPHIVPQPPVILIFRCKLTVRFSAGDALQDWRSEGNDC